MKAGRYLHQDGCSSELLTTLVGDSASPVASFQPGIPAGEQRLQTRGL